MMRINLTSQSDSIDQTPPQQPIHNTAACKPRERDVDLLSIERSLPIPKPASVPSTPLTLVEREAPVCSIEEALLSITKIHIKVVVSSPSLIEKGWLSSYWEYPILTTAGPYKSYTRRRFSDLERLHSNLQFSYPGTMLPEMPQKSFVKNFDSQFLEKRRLCIEKYLNFVVNHTKIRRAPEVPLFLLTPDPLNLKSRPVSPSCGTVLEGMYANLMVKLVHPAKYNEEIQEILNKVLAFDVPTKVVFAAYSQYASLNRASSKCFLSMTGTKAVEYCLKYQQMNRLRDQINHSWELEINRIASFHSCVESYMNLVSEYQCNYFIIQEHLKKQKVAENLDDMVLYTQQIQKAQELVETLSNQLLEAEKNIRIEAEAFEEERRRAILNNLKNVVECEVQCSMSNKEDKLSVYPNLY